MAEDTNDSNLAQLRAKAERADQLEAQLALRDKQDAFRAAGLDPTSGPGKLVFDTYQPGDQPIDAASVLAFAGQYGIAPVTTSEPAPIEQAPPSLGTPSIPPPQLSPQEQTHFALTSAANGAEPDPNSVPIGKRAYAAYDEQMKNGRPQDVAAIAGIGALIGAAASGDPAAIYDGQKRRDDAGYGNR